MVPEWSVLLLSRYEFLILQHGRFNELHQRIAEEVRIGPIVEPERYFIEVGRKMLCKDFVPRSHDPALKQRKRRFNPVPAHVYVTVQYTANRCQLWFKGLRITSCSCPVVRNVNASPGTGRIQTPGSTPFDLRAGTSTAGAS